MSRALQQTEGLSLEEKRALLAQLLQKKAAKPNAFPLSFAQQRLWFLDQLEPHSPLYNMPRAVRLQGRLNVEALQQALKVIVSRHETLRTTFTAVDGIPMQVIAEHPPADLPIIDLSARPEAAREVEVQGFIREEAERPFDLARDLPLRATLLRLGPEEHILLLTVHHIASDGWSMGILSREVAALYNAFSSGRSSPLPELPIQYADYAAWQRQWLQGEVLESQLAYWKLQLGGSPSMLELPMDRPRPAVQTYRGAKQSLLLVKSLGDALRALSQREGVTLFMMLLAAFQTLLHRYTGQDDIIVGSPIANRTRTEIEGLIGLFVNTLVLRTDLSGNPTFQELLGRVREVALGAYAHQDLPFEKLVEELHPERSLSHTPLFQVFINMLNPQDNRIALPGLVAEVLSSSEVEPKFDLTLYIREQKESIQFNLVYNADLFDRTRMVELLQQFQHLLGQMVANPQASILDYSLVTPAAQALLPDPSTVLPEPSYECVTNTVLSWSDRTPGQTAICQGERIWTYCELAERAQALARTLLNQGLEREEVVAVTGVRSFGLIASMTAVLASGGVLLTLDPNLPSDRQRLMLREAGVKRLLYVGRCRAEDNWVRDLESVVITWLEANGVHTALPREISNSKAIELPRLAPDDPAYLFFTSGSTGTPKGVLGCHKGLSHFLKWQRETFAVGPHDRCGQLTGLSFDVVLRDVFLPLSSGASLHLPEELDDPRSGQILSWLEREKITLLHTVPALAQTWLMNVPQGVTLLPLRWVFFAGEPLTESLVRQWRETFPKAGSIVNLYGPTETTLAKCFYRVPSDPLPGVQPIGRPLPETQALVIREGRQLCGIGEPGEIVIRTPFRSLGYINAPAENQKRFVDNPFRGDRRDLIYYTGDRGRYRPDGSVELLGRLDDQVKIRGVRVEPDEVTAILSQHPVVKSSAVVARKNEQGEAFLVAYVVGSEQNRSITSDLRSYLSTQLPSPMIPSAFMLLDALPLTPNGKVDRRALPIPDQKQTELPGAFVAPRDALEFQLTTIWEQALGLQSIGVTSNFFDLGGHSLLAVRLFAQIEKTFGKRLPLATLFQAPTVEQLANVLRQEEWSPPWSSLVPIQPGGSKPPFFCVHAHGGEVMIFKDLAKHLGPDQPFYGLQALWLNGDQPRHTSIKELAAHYLKEIRTFQPEGPYFLGGLCFGGKVAFELAQQLYAQGQQIGLLALLDSYAPGYPQKLPWIQRQVILRVSLHVGNLRGLGRKERLNYLLEKGKIGMARAETRLKKMACKLYLGLGVPLPRTLQEAQEPTRRARLPYMPSIYPGKIILFRPSHKPGGEYYHPPDMGWSGLVAGGLEIYDIPGPFGSIISEPYVDVMAEHLLACLQAAQTNPNSQGQQ
jgi:amino acid adenylation domain-containing protein